MLFRRGFTGDSDLVVSRNGVEFFRLGTAYSTAGGAPADIVFSNAGISSSWIFGNAFAHRSADTDTDFLGAVSAGNSWAKLYMRYEHVAENLHTYTDVDLEQDKRLYFHKETSKNNYISSTNIAAVNHTNFVNEDPNGDLNFLLMAVLDFMLHQLKLLNKLNLKLSKWKMKKKLE